MITFTRCAFMAKQACATFSQVVRKTTPPIANNFLKFFFILFALLTLNAATAWAETTTLTNANIASLYNSSQTSWRSISNMTDINGFKYNAYAILNKHSNATSTYKFLQIKKYASNVAYYVQVPQMPGNITTISMTVSSSQKPMTDGGNTYTLYFSNSSKTSTTGTGVASGTGDKSVTIDCSTLNLKEGYITANGSVRIWDITVTYESATPPTPAKTYDVTWMVNGEEWDKTEGVEENTQITNLPTEPTDNCGNKVFQGWTDKPISGTTNTKPSILFKDKSPEITEGLTTFYAVFATETNSGSGNMTTTFTPNVDDLSTGKNGITIKMSNTAGASGYYQIYKSSSMTIETKDVMTSFTLTCTAENQSKYGPGNITFTEGTYSYSSYTGTWTGNATSLTSSKAAEQLRIKNIVVTTSSVSTTISDYTTSCSQQPIQLAKPTGLEAKEITSNSAILSWDEVENKSSYKVTITDDHDYTETFTVTDETKSVTNLSPNTTYYWTVQAIGDGTNYTDSETSEQSSFNTLVPCTDAVTISKGTSDNGSFKLDKTGEQSTCNGAVTVTLSDIQPAAGYKFSAITQSGINTGVTIDNNDQKVTYAQHTIGNSTINVTFIELPKYTVSFSTGTDNPTQADVTESVGGQGITLPVGPAPACTDWTFAGWAEADATETTTEPTLFAEGTNYKPSGNCTLYAVYSTTAETTGFTGYEKVTEEPEDWSGKYLLSTGIYTATGAFDDTGTKGHLVRETYTPGIDEKTEWEFTLATVDNTRYSILFPDGSSYLGYASSTNFARSADVVPSESVAYLWTPSTSGITNVSATSRKIADNGSADFRPYSSPSSGIVYLYKRIEGVVSSTIYNSNPTCTQEPGVELQSIKISGDLTKKTYTVGDDLDFGGLTVTAKYSNATSKNVTNEVEWSDVTLTVGQTSVTLTATYEGKKDDITITGLTVSSPATPEPEGEWVLTSLADITCSDLVVITMKNSNGTYALTNGNGTSDAPKATEVEITNDKLKTEPSEILQWVVMNNNGELTIYPVNDYNSWLYCFNDNDGVRVGDNENAVFTIDAISGYLYHLKTARYLGVYNNSEWRCYTTVNNNIKEQTLAFFVKKDANPNPCEKPVDDGINPVATFIFNTAEGLDDLGIDYPNTSAGSGAYKNDMSNDESYTQEGITFTNVQNGSTATRVWCSSVGNLDLRIYQNATVKFSVPDNMYIRKIIFNGDALSSISPNKGNLKSKIWSGREREVLFSVADGADVVKIYTISFALEYTRDVKPDEYGTICLPYGSSDYTGAEFYEVSSVEYGKGLWLDQLAAGTALAAGKPYIFRATAEKLAVVYKGEKKDSPVDGVNGLTGTFTAIAANSTLVGHYIIALNQIWVANDKNTLPAYRAYINAEDVPTTAQAQLPGRRRVCMGENAATGLDNITNGENNTIKVIENGQLIIIRNGEKYNIHGQKL